MPFLHMHWLRHVGAHIHNNKQQFKSNENSKIIHEHYKQNLQITDEFN